MTVTDHRDHRVRPGQWQSFAERHLNVTNIAGSEYLCLCPFHQEHSASFQFNIDSGLFICFSGSCGAKGNIWKLADHLGVTLPRKSRIVTPDHIDAMLEEALDLLSGKNRRVRQKAHGSVLDESTLAAYDIPNAYWQERGLTQETVELFGLGYDVMNDAVTIPIRDQYGQLLGIIRRYLEHDAPLRYKYPRGFKRSYNLFASWLLESDPGSTVVVCEGSIDAMKVRQAGFPGVAQYGSSMSMPQVQLLQRAGVTTVVLFYDNDKAGKKATLDVTGQGKINLRDYFVVKYVQYPSRTIKDPGVMSSELITECVNTATLCL